jgi:hypothetical protein
VKGKVNFIFALMIIMITAGCTTKTIPLQPKRVVNKKLLCRIDPSTCIPDSIIVSHDNRHVAWIAQAGAEKWVVWDGREGKHYGEIQYLGFSPQGNHLVYWTKKENRIVMILDQHESKPYDEIDRFTFSPEGSRSAYKARIGNKWLAVVDGRESRLYDEVLISSFSSWDFTFSPDGKHLVYWASIGNKAYLVLDGQESEPVEDIASPVYSPDGKHLAYVMKSRAKWQMVIDGQKGKPYLGCGWANFSPDSRHVAYQAFDINETNRNRKDIGVERIVLDGNEGPFYFHITSIHFSPDSRRLAYIICDEPSAGCIRCGHRVIVDGKEGKRYAHIPGGFDIDYPFFSPDSSHLAYLVITPDQSRNNVTWLTRRWPNWQIVLDDQEDKIYNEILGTCFNPETNQIFYFAKSGEKHFAVDNGHEGKAYDDILYSFQLFSPDFKKLVYAARLGKQWFMVVNGKEEKPYQEISNTFFSPDSKHLAYMAKANDQWLIVVDKIEGMSFDQIFKPEINRINWTEILFDTANSFHYLARKGNSIFLVEEKIN